MEKIIPIDEIRKDEKRTKTADFLLAAFPHLTGIIVAEQDKETGKIVAYWNGDYVESVSEERTPYPKMFSSIKGAERTALRLSQLSPDAGGVGPDFEFKVCLWLAPEHEWEEEPLEKYTLLTGQRFPGSPRK